MEWNKKKKSDLVVLSVESVTTFCATGGCVTNYREAIRIFLKAKAYALPIIDR